MDVSTSDNRDRSNAARRQEESRRREAKARRKKADDKAAADAIHRRQMEYRQYLNKLQEKRVDLGDGGSGPFFIAGYDSYAFQDG